MFQEKDLESYRQIKAPAELKNRISHSVKRTQKKQRTALVAAAASIVLMISVSTWQYPADTILSVNDTDVTYRAVEIESTSRGILVASEGSRQEHRITVPLEIDVTETAHVTVSAGTMQQVSEEAEELVIHEKTVIYWTVDGNMQERPVCTIMVGEKTYRYGISWDEKASVYTIYQLN